MRNLLEFLSRYRFFLLFLVIEVFCFILIINNNYYQRSRMMTTTFFITGHLNKMVDNIGEYFQLKKVNQSLAEENTKLRSSLKNAVSGIRDSVSTQVANPGFDYVSARIISNSVQKRNNYFMLDKGILDGVKEDMGVVAPEGVVGIIIEVSDHFSTGISVLHKNSRISGRIKKNNHLVSVLWDGKDYRTGSIEDIPSHVNVTAGDTVITSGNSHIFPEGIPIGIVKSVEYGGGQSFLKGKIRFSVDYNNLSYVYVIRNRYMYEQKELNSTLTDE